MNLELNRKKLSIGIVLGTLALSAFFLARGATSLAAGALLPVSAAPTVKVAAARAEPLPGSTPPDQCAILKRNIFDPETGALCPPKETAVVDDVQTEAPPAPPAEGEMPPPCEGGTMKLVAAVHSEQYPEWSFAQLSNGQGEPLLYRLGGHIDDKEVYAIYPKAVFFKQASGHYCSVTIFADPTAIAQPANFSGRPGTPTPEAQPVPPPTAPVAPIAGGGITEEELNANITAVSDTKFTVQRSLVDKILQNQAEIMRSARIVPHEENGQVVGVKLYGIRRNSLLGKLGMQNGDMLRTINGFEMSSPDSALEAYSRLRSANNLSVSVVRRGRQMDLGYDIQ